MTLDSKARIWVNVLTLSRIPGVCAFMVAALIRAHDGSSGWAWAALALLVVSALTDLVDGWLARRLGVVSAFGAHADPLADKIFYLIVLPTFVFLIARSGATAHALSMLILTVIYLLRDQWVSFLRAVGAAAGIGGGAIRAGKLRTLASFIYFCLLYPVLAFEWLRAPVAVLITAEFLLSALTLFSLVVYTRVYAGALRASVALPSGSRNDSG